MSQRQQQEAQETIDRAMRENPMGMIMGATARQAHALFWADRDMPEKILLANLISGVAKSAIQRGLMTKMELLHNLAEILETTTNVLTPLNMEAKDGKEEGSQEG